MRLPFHSSDDHQRFAKVRLRLAGRMRQRHEHLPAPQSLAAHILARDAVAAPEPMLVSQPVEDPLGRVPLLGRSPLVVFQDGVDHAQPRPQPGPLHRLLPLIPRRYRIAQHLPRHVARDAELPRDRPLTPPLHQDRTSHTPVYLHPVHPSGVPWTRLPQQPHPQNQSPAVAYFFTATASRSRGLLWPIFTLTFSAIGSLLRKSLRRSHSEPR